VTIQWVCEEGEGGATGGRRSERGETRGGGEYERPGGTCWATRTAGWPPRGPKKAAAAALSVRGSTRAPAPRARAVVVSGWRGRTRVRKQAVAGAVIRVVERPSYTERASTAAGQVRE